MKVDANSQTVTRCQLGVGSSCDYSVKAVANVLVTEGNDGTSGGHFSAVVLVVQSGRRLYKCARRVLHYAGTGAGRKRCRWHA